MQNIDLGQKIKELRSHLGLSQDQLADLTKLSLRTIQRIENNETDPRGDTLNRLATALNIPKNELFNWTEKEDSSYLILINLSALSYFIFPLLGIILPLLIWAFKRDEIKNMNETGKKLLNFQISWCLVIFFLYLWLIGFPDFQVETLRNISRTILGLLSFLLLYGFNLILIVVNTIRSAKSKKVFYYPAIPFLR